MITKYVQVKKDKRTAWLISASEVVRFTNTVITGFIYAVKKEKWWLSKALYGFKDNLWERGSESSNTRDIFTWISGILDSC